MPVIHDIRSAAELLRVEPEMIRRWIKEGLRHVAIPSAKRPDAQHPREVRFREEWLLEWFDSLSRRHHHAPDAPPPAPQRAAKGRGRAVIRGGDDGLWECPV